MFQAKEYTDAEIEHFLKNICSLLVFKIKRFDYPLSHIWAGEEFEPCELFFRLTWFIIVYKHICLLHYSKHISPE